MSKAVRIQKTNEQKKREIRRFFRTTRTGAKIMSHVSAKNEYTFHSYTYFYRVVLPQANSNYMTTGLHIKQQQGERERERE